MTQSQFIVGYCKLSVDVVGRSRFWRNSDNFVGILLVALSLTLSAAESQMHLPSLQPDTPVCTEGAEQRVVTDSVDST